MRLADLGKHGGLEIDSIKKYKKQLDIVIFLVS